MKIKSVKIIKEKCKVYDVEVEHDHCFVCSDIVLHNTMTCRAYDGKKWNMKFEPIGHKLPFNTGAPRHWGCRSIISTEAKSIAELDKVHKGFKTVPATQRAAFGKPVKGDMTYNGWLKTQLETVQKEVLGIGKWKLWKENNLSMADLVDQRGNSLTLEELKKRY